MQAAIQKGEVEERIAAQRHKALEDRIKWDEDQAAKMAAAAKAAEA